MKKNLNFKIMKIVQKQLNLKKKTNHLEKNTVNVDDPGEFANIKNLKETIK